MKIALISHKSFLEDKRNGWEKIKDREILLLQKFDHYEEISENDLSLFEQLKIMIKNHEIKIFLYLRAETDNDWILKELSSCNPDSKQIFFVSCVCKERKKLKELQKYNLYLDTKYVNSDCHGLYKMKEIYQNPFNI